MKRRDFIKGSIVMGAAVSPSIQAKTILNRIPVEKQAPKTAKPHIVFIISDQHRGDSLGCMGHPAVITPSIDKLAEEGNLFVSGYSSTPSSTPARAGLLTGLSAWHHGMLGYGKVAKKYTYEFPQMMRNLGYYTFGIGKMHWHPQNALHGFHATLLDESGRSESPDFICDYRKWFQTQAPGKDPFVTGIGWNSHKAGVYKLPEELHPTRWTGDRACELIRNYDNEKPLFLKVSFARPHSPYDPPKRYLDMYKDADVPTPAVGDWCGRDAKLLDPEKADPDAPFGNFGDEYAKNSRRHYYASITFIDDQVGEIVRTLKEKGMYENTLICFTSDHGDMMGDHYHWRKTYAYEGSVKIPYVVKWPEAVSRDNKRRGFISEPVELRDFLPTFIDIAGGSVPPDMDGKSLLTLVKSDTPEWRKYIDLEHATCYRPENYWCALTDGKIKYIWFFYNGQEQLFDLEKDPQELHDCALLPAYKMKLTEMRNEMVVHLSERGDGFVKDNQLVRRDKTLLYSPNYPKE